MSASREWCLCQLFEQFAADAIEPFTTSTPEMEELRSQRGLQTNSFIRLRKFDQVVEIMDMGASEAILTNKAHLRETAREMIRRGVYPQDGGWNGWLGRYQKALVDTAFELEQEKAKERERRRNRGLGR